MVRGQRGDPAAWSDALGEDASFSNGLTLEVADYGIHRYADGGGEWPCGSGAANTPGLCWGSPG